MIVNRKISDSRIHPSMKTKFPNSRLIGKASSVILAAFSMVPLAQAANVYWEGVPGVSADTNWSDTANWSWNGTGTLNTYYNEVEFTGVGANAINNFAVNNVLDSTSGAPSQMPIWQLDYIPVNG